MSQYTFETIGYINSCFKEKFGIPRQPGLVPGARATLEIASQFSQEEAFRELKTFSHIWILFVFHHCLDRPWKPTVRPPRLGGNRRVGVFATRSGFRPNAIGQSAVKLVSIEKNNGRIVLHLDGVDLVHGTPVLDIKPYLPYADAISGAASGFAPEPPRTLWSVTFSTEARVRCEQLEKTRHPGLGQLITHLLALDPRPGYRTVSRGRRHGMRLYDLNITFRFESDHVEVLSIDAVTDLPQ